MGEKKKLSLEARAHSLYRARDWRIAARATFLGARRYSVFVKFMKSALPLAALGLGILVLIYVLQPRDVGRLAMTFERLGRIQGDLAMVKPRLSGTSDDGLPFVVSAATATQEGRGSDLVRLEDIVADFNLKDGTALHLVAANGIVNTKSHVLQLSGGIHLVSQDGYDARTPSAVADLKEGTVHGENGIAAQGNLGRITARRFALNRSTKQLRFFGNVQTLLNRSTADKPESSP
jgi:lipopolysaccharide export system protein LptC